jgi:activating signal cointegrator complex subunit 3
LVKQDHQVMVFVHARNATIKTATKLKDMAKNQGEIGFFQPDTTTREYGAAQSQMSRSKNKQLREIFNDGFGVHHAGMLRSDRNLVERLFKDGHIKLLVCTATLGENIILFLKIFKVNVIKSFALSSLGCKFTSARRHNQRYRVV